MVCAFDLSRFKRFVDLGGATGHLAIAACERYPEMTAILFDLPRVIDAVGPRISLSSVASRIELQRGDFFRPEELPQGDLFGLGRILHDWPDDKVSGLLRSIHQRLSPGGGILLAEKLLQEDKTGPVSAQLQSLNMLVCTEGRERTLGEFRALLESAGFTDSTRSRYWRATGRSFCRERVRQERSVVLLRRLAVLCSVLFLLMTTAAHAQFVHTQGTEIVDGSGKPLLIRGISIGNWFVLEGYFWRFGGLSQAQTEVELVFTDLLGPTHAQEFLYNWRQNFMSEADVHRIKQDGFNTIRIPLHSKYFKTDDDEGFQLIDQLSKWCSQEHIYIILMLESGIGGFTGEASDDGPGYPWLLKDAGMQNYVSRSLAADREPL